MCMYYILQKCSCPTEVYLQKKKLFTKCVWIRFNWLNAVKTHQVQGPERAVILLCYIPT